MRIRSPYAFTLTVSVAIAAAALAQDGKPLEGLDGPVLELRESSFDFGYTPQGAQISHAFWMMNTGTDTLLLRDIKPG
ncbi:MAG TPA: hypothetical protein VGB22_08030 [candidate division Zixibacteria bacterium]